VNDPNPSQGILLRAGDLNSMGHNLDIIISSQRAFTCFQKLLAIAPEHPFGNYLYGKFLAETGNPGQALPYIEKARAFGVVYADYTLGMIYLTLGDKQKALEHLEAYRQVRPDDGKVSFLIDGIRNGKIQLKTSGQ
jgi:tetratricopeptide (TPR) repeat protein